VNQPFLTVTAGPAQGRYVPIDAKGVRIGRDPANEMHIDDPEVSRHHARVILHNGVVWVQDAGSRNGVFVNGGRVSGNQQIGPGDQIIIGVHEFLIQVEGTQTDSSVSVNMNIANVPAPPPEASSGSNRVLVIGGVVAVLVAVIAVAALFGGAGENRDQSTSVEPTISVDDLFPSATSDGAVVPGDPANEDPTSASKLRSRIVSDGKTTGDVPDPPPGLTAKDLTDKADGLYQSQRWFDALVTYKQAMKLSPECQICPLRIETITRRIAEDVEQNYSDGLTYQASRQYREAARSFQTVLQLAEPGSELFLQAEEGLKQVQEAMGIPF